jgi:Domain of unknown function (DUF4386)
MTTNLDRTGRITGALYATVIVTGMFSLVYVPGQLHLTGNAEAVARSITSNQTLYRLGIVSWLVNSVAFLLLPLAFYRLFHAVHRQAAIVMVAFALISIPLSLIAAANQLDLLALLGGEPPLQAIGVESRNAMMMQSLSAYDNAIFVAQLFWGLWLLPLGYLVLKSGMVPRVFGVLLMLGCMGYLVEEIGGLLYRGFGTTLLSQFVTLPAAAGEIGLGFWLLVRGIRQMSLSSG